MKTVGVIKYSGGITAPAEEVTPVMDVCTHSVGSHNRRKKTLRLWRRLLDHIRLNMQPAYTYHDVTKIPQLFSSLVGYFRALHILWSSVQTFQLEVQ